MKITETTKKTSEILAEMRKRFPVYCYYNDDELDRDFPPPAVIATREFADNAEADEAYKNMSANDLEKAGVNGITLRERLLMEIQYFDATGKHLDIENVTLCSGSRHSDGGVPYVYWYTGDRKVYVCWHDPSYSASSLRARAAVTLDSCVSEPSDLNESIKKVKAAGYVVYKPM